MAFSITEIYVDPSIAADSGAGTIGDPYGDLEYAIEQETFDTTNGTRVNVKNGTDEILVAELDTALSDTSVSVAWAPAQAAPLIFQGYTTAAGDGGIGGISGNGSIGIMSSIKTFVAFLDMHCHNTGSVRILELGSFCTVLRCHVNNSTGGGIKLGAVSVANRNYVHKTGNIGIWLNSGGYAAFNTVRSDGEVFTFAGMYTQAAEPTIMQRNLIILEEAGDNQNGMSIGKQAGLSHNAIWSNAGTGSGINLLTANTNNTIIMNNLVEGFSGSGGKGIDLGQTGASVADYSGNSVFNCATAFVAPTNWALLEEANETLSASPFTDAAGNDFSPVDTGLVKEGAIPSIFGNGAL